MEAAAMKLAKLPSGYFVGSLLFLGSVILLFGPGLVEGSAEKSFNPSTTIQAETSFTSTVRQD
jgi:hypothetical protein